MAWVGAVRRYPREPTANAMNQVGSTDIIHLFIHARRMAYVAWSPRLSYQSAGGKRAAFYENHSPGSRNHTGKTMQNVPCLSSWREVSSSHPTDEQAKVVAIYTSNVTADDHAYLPVRRGCTRMTAQRHAEKGCRYASRTCLSAANIAYSPSSVEE